LISRATICIVLWTVALGNFAWTLFKHRHWLSGEGKIVDVEESQDAEGDMRYAAVIEFKHFKYGVMSFTDEAKRGSNKFAIGSFVPIRYDKTTRSRAVIDGFYSKYHIAIFFMGLAMFFSLPLSDT
jgi:hypothetical protein